jgi:hypothetical protein
MRGTMAEVTREPEITHEQRQSLWLLTLGPAIWIAHFGLVYAAASIWCAKVTSDGSLGAMHQIVAGLTIAALAAIAIVGRVGWVRHTYGEEDDTVPPHDADTPEDRHRFLGLATLLLAWLSGVATIYVAASAFFFDTCR